MKLGPKGISIKKLNATNFEKPFLDFVNNEVYKTNAEKFSKEMQNEFNINKLINNLKITDYNDV